MKTNDRKRYLEFILVFCAIMMLAGINVNISKDVKTKAKTEHNHNDSVNDNISMQEKEKFYETKFKNARDSLLIVNGFYNEKYDELNTLDKDRKTLDSIENKLSERPQLTKLKNTVQNAADKIIDNYANQMLKIVQPVNKNISATIIANTYKTSGHTQDLYIFVSPDKPILDGEPITLRDVFLYNLFNNDFEWADTAEKNKNQIKGKVYELCKKMEKDLYGSRKKIEKMFANYYSVLDPKNIPTQYKHLIGDPAINMGEWGVFVDYNNIGDVAVGRQADLCLDTINVEFFEDKNTKFKTDNNDSLHIYNDSLQKHLVFYIGDLWDTIAYNYDFQSKKTNIELGYCINTNNQEKANIKIREQLYSKPTNKIDTITGYKKLKKESEFLEQEIERKCNIKRQIHDSIVVPATIQAKDIANKKYWNKFNQKHK